MRSFKGLIASCIQLAIFAVAATAQEIPESLLKAVPAPEWAETTGVDPDKVIPGDDISSGEYYRNIELQWHIPSKTKFYRTVLQIVTEAGLDGNGERAFTFDPEYQTQTIHWVRIIRDGETIFDYKPEALRLYNTESDIASRMLDGSLTALVILEDLRVGDIIDVASSLQGTNPAFGDHAVLRRSVNWSVPVGRQLTRILADPDQQLETKVFLGSPPVASTNETLGLKEWRHELIDNPPIRNEPSVPFSFRVYGALHASSFKSWGEVADWAVELYPVDNALPEDLQSEVEKIVSEVESAKERTTEALYFVQGNVRYLGLEMGHGAYKPREPELVWERRFGDCKDKALLLVEMLREMNIEASPALVNTSRESAIINFLPSPIAFNHVIVCVNIEDETFWLDPTYNRQFGPLDKLPVDSYGYALLIREGENALTQVEQHPAYDNFISASTKLEVGPPGEEATMEVTTRYGGRAAARIRNYFNNTSLNEIGKSYTEYWAGEYPNPKLSAPVEYTEFPSLGELETKEIYSIPDAWEPGDNEDDEKVYFNFTPATLKSELVFPKRIERNYPYFAGEPIRVVDQFEVHMFEPWNHKNDDSEISGPGVEYTNKATWGAVVKADYKLTIKDSVIPPENVLEFEGTMQKIKDDLGWELSWDPNFVATPDNEGASDSTLSYDNMLAYLLYGFGMMLAFILLLPFLLKNRLNPPKLIPSGAAEYEGIGGWLILPIIGLVLTPLGMLAQIFGEDMLWIFDKAQWDLVAETYSHAMMNVIGFECIYHGFLLAAPILLIIMTFQKRWFLPAMMIAFYAIQPIFHIIDSSLYGILDLDLDLPESNDLTDLIRSIVTAILWGSYFAVSERVKATFRS